MPDSSSSQSAYLHYPGSSTPAFLVVGIELRTNNPAYLIGAESVTPSSTPVYIMANVLSTDNSPCYVAGAGGLIRNSVPAFIGNWIYRSSVSVRFGGDGTGAIMAERAYIELETSDTTIKKRFRVLAQGYDDGTLNKAEKIDRTIGGGIDHSMGAIYEEWNPIIRVRQTETDSNYGTLQELRDFYEYNDPGGTITPDITFYDHLNQSHTVHMVGSFRKQLLGTKVEGSSAWYIVSLKMVEV